MLVENSQRGFLDDGFRRGGYASKLLVWDSLFLEGSKLTDSTVLMIATFNLSFFR